MNCIPFSGQLLWLLLALVITTVGFRIVIVWIVLLRRFTASQFYPIVRPFITVYQSNDKAVLGGIMTLTCSDSRGVPPPEFTWSKCTGSELNSCQPLQSGDQNLIIMQTMSNTSILKMNPVQIFHSGTYRCNASNAFGTDSQPGTVQVVCKLFTVVWMHLYVDNG